MSSRLATLSDLAEGLAGVVGRDRRAVQSWLPDESKTYPRREFWNGVSIERVWRPNLKQSSTKGRLLNAAWMLAAWSLRGIFGQRRKHEVMIVGTDPILSVLTAIPGRGSAVAV